MLIAILSDIHEDFLRLEETMKLLENKKVDQYIFLGDMVGFGAPYYSYIKSRNSNKIIEMLKEKFDVILKGNHDLFDIKMLPNDKSLINLPDNYYTLDYFERKKLANGMLHSYDDNQLNSLLNKDNELYIASLPEYKIINYDNYNILFSHYSYPDVTGSLIRKIENPIDLIEHFSFMKNSNCLYSFSGHDHFDGIKVFTETEVKVLQFNEKYRLPRELVWLNGPCIANGTHKNGFILYNTDTREIEAIPLNTEPHVKFGAYKI